MPSRASSILSVLTASSLIAIAALHGSGFGYVREAVSTSQLPGLLKRVLPALWLYPSVLLTMLAVVVIFSLWQRQGKAFVLSTVAAIVAANAVLGFVLGGVVPGGILALVAGLVLLVARLERA